MYKHVFIVMAIMVAEQQLAINAVMFFSMEIFKQARIKAPYSQYATLCGLGYNRSIYTKIDTLKSREI